MERITLDAKDAAGRFRELGYFWGKSQNHTVRVKRDAGRGGSAGGQNINTATHPKNNEFHESGSVILESVAYIRFSWGGSVRTGLVLRVRTDFTHPYREGIHKI